MRIQVRLIDAATGESIGEESYPVAPRVGDEIMFMPRDWHIYRVEGVRIWPIREQTPDDDLNQREPDSGRVEARVRCNGFID